MVYNPQQQQPYSFTDMQRRGMARPPSAASGLQPQTAAAPTPTGMMQPQGVAPAPQPQGQPANPPYGMQQPTQPNTAQGRLGPGGSITPPAPGGSTPGTSGTSGGFPSIEPHLMQQYFGYQQPGGFQQPQGGQMDQSLQNQLMQGLQNPSAYNAPQVKQTFDMLNRQLGQGFDVQRQQINEDMAKRGIYNSTIAGGRLGDLATNQANAQRDLATQLSTQAAQTYGSDRNAAIGAAGNYQQNQFGNALAGYGANLTGNQQGFNQQQQLLQNMFGYQNQQFGQDLQTNQQNMQQQNSDMDNYLKALLGLNFGG